MSVKSFAINGKNISENIVKPKLEHVIYTYVKNFDNFLTSLPDKTENTFHS